MPTLKLTLTLLGSFQVHVNHDRPVTKFRSANVRGLLVYLALNAGRPLERERLATLFWPDEPDSVAKTNLRQIIYQVRKSLGEEKGRPFLAVDRRSVQIDAGVDLQVDVARFEEHMAAETWADAVAVYAGELLPGFTCDSRDFEEWLRVERERLNRLGLDALYELGEAELIDGQYGAARDLAARQLALEPWRESAHQQLMRALALSGERNGALAQFDVCYETLEQELGIEPSDEMVALYEQIATGVIGPPEDQEERGLGHLPRPPTTFINRLAELSHMIQTLDRPDCRLLSLVGPGGVGKTRLAIEVGHKYEAEVGHKAHFVSLLGVSTLAGAINGIGRAIGLRLPDPARGQDRLLAQLREMAGLLILDNAEPLLATEDHAAFVELINRLTTEAESLTLLLTSRRPLKAQQEIVLPLQGLSLPSPSGPSESLPLERLTRYDAVLLFRERAQQALLPFEITSRNSDDIIAICRQLEGLPLGIELTAAQLAHYSVAEIRSNLEHVPLWLEADLVDLPPRHRALHRVFEQSWFLLTPDAQQVLSACAIFQGGFTRGAARAVLGDGIAQLETLIERSLLRREHSERGETRRWYSLSPLLSAWLRANHPFMDEVADSHAAFYLRWAVEHRMEQHFVERENILAAWDRVNTAKRVMTPAGWRAEWITALNAGPTVPDASPPAFDSNTAPYPNLLAGRSRELGQLRAALAPLTGEARSNGGFVTIIGEAGIGKSYLVDYLEQELGGVARFLAPCDETSAQGLLPFRSWLRTYFGQVVSGSDAARFHSRLDDLIAATSRSCVGRGARRESFLLGRDG